MNYFVIQSSFLQKPTVFLFNDGENVADAQGYAADIVQEIQHRLNFTDILVPNTGFGAYRNDSWNGMVGDLLYGVSGALRHKHDRKIFRRGKSSSLHRPYRKPYN